MRIAFAVAALCLAGGCATTVQSGAGTARAEVEPLIVGETFTLASAALGEARRINVYLPPGYHEAEGARFPVLYMPDGGLAEDFLHVAGLVQVSVGNGTMRPLILVGIENTERRRDLTGPTIVASDAQIAPRVGGSAAFRSFLRAELMPHIGQRYRTTDERAIVGESLAGLFVVETLLLEPALFDSYIAFDPSLWWNDGALVHTGSAQLSTQPVDGRTLYLATSKDAGLEELMRSFTAFLGTNEARGLRWFHEPMPQETHATIYHPAALKAFRTLFKPAP